MVHGMNVDTGQKSWLTPPRIINALGTFSLDPCCPPNMPWRTAARMVCRPDDGLAVDWTGKRVWLNPPYGREIPKWVRKCYKESRKPDTLVVMLIPARTDTSYFHDYIYHRAREIRFIRGRLHFNDSKSGAPFPSMIVIF